MGGCCPSRRTVENEPPQIVSEEPPLQYFSFQEYVQMAENPEIEGYRILEEIGRGAMGRVYLAEEKESGGKFAVKVYNNSALTKVTLGNDESPYEMVKREIDLMWNMRHRYIIPVCELIPDEKTNSTCIVMPYAVNGTLESCLKEDLIGGRSIIICFHQMAEGLRYCHELNIVHRDIKPENMLCLSETYFILSDFSVSQQLSDPEEELDDTKGSPAFLSPEECSGDAYKPKPCDVWAYGVSLYLSVYGILPFGLEEGQNRAIANTVLFVIDQLESEELQFPEKLRDGVDPLVIDLIKSILVKDPSKRPTFEEIVKHEVFREARAIDEELIAEERAQQNEE